MNATSWTIVAIAAVLVLAAIVWALLRQRQEHRRTQAGQIREEAAEKSVIVEQRQARADETAARARGAQADAEAKTAEATRLKNQARVQHSDATTSRDDVVEQQKRADKIDPDTGSPPGPENTGPDEGIRRS